MPERGAMELLAGFWRALEEEVNQAGVQKQRLARLLGISPSSVTALFSSGTKRGLKKPPDWGQVERIVRFCWKERDHGRFPGSSKEAVSRGLEDALERHVEDWRFRLGLLIRDMDRARTQAGIPAPRIFVHHGHTLLGRTPLTCRRRESEEIARWCSDGSEQRNVLCLTGPGGQGKSALAWTHFNEFAADGLIRIWHGFGHSTDEAQEFRVTLAAAARAIFGVGDGDERAIARLLERMAQEGGLLVLDGLEHLYGPSTALIDMLGSRFRTIADPRADDLIRQFAGLEKVKVVLTCRLAPAFADDPVLRNQLYRLHLEPIDPSSAVPFWQHRNVRGTTADLSAATAALRGSPLLMHLIAGKVLMCHDGDINGWLSAERAKFPEDEDADLRRLIPRQILDELPERARQMLLMLAVSRRPLSKALWRDLVTGWARRDVEPQENRSGPEIEKLNQAIYTLLKGDLIHRDDTGHYDTHELVADAVIAAAGEDELENAYRKLQDIDGGSYIFGSGFTWDKLAGMEDSQRLAASIGKFLSLIDRRAFVSAQHILATELFPALRYRLGDLRRFRMLTAHLDAAFTQAGMVSRTPSYGVELALADGNWAEALALIDAEAPTSQDDDVGENQVDRDLAASANENTDRATALLGLGEFTEAYRHGSMAFFYGMRAASVEDAAEYDEWMRDSSVAFMFRTTKNCSGQHSFVAAGLVLSKTLRSAGFYRAALLVLLDSFPWGHSHPGELSAHWEELAALMLESGHLELARDACDLALKHAGEDLIEERLAQARTLDLELRHEQGDPTATDEVSGLLVTVARLGFGALVRRLLALESRSKRSFSEAIAWQYGIDLSSLARRRRVPPAAEDISGELERLAELRLPGRWAELAALRNICDQGETRQHPVMSYDLLKRAWNETIAGSAHWEEQLAAWVNAPAGTRHPDYEDDASRYAAAVDRLELLETDVQAAQDLAATWTAGDPRVAFDLLSKSVFYDRDAWYWDPHGMYFDEESMGQAMIAAARASGRIRDAAGVVGQIMMLGWRPTLSALEVANLCRENGDYKLAAMASMWGSEVANAWDPGHAPHAEEPVVRVALAIGLGLDFLALGTPDVQAVDSVRNILSGRRITPMSASLGRDLLFLGDDIPGRARRDDEDHQVIGGFTGMPRKLDYDTLEHAALSLFQKIAGSLRSEQDGELARWVDGRRLYWPGHSGTEHEARSAFARIRGHDTLIGRLAHH